MPQIAQELIFAVDIFYYLKRIYFQEQKIKNV